MPVLHMPTSSRTRRWWAAGSLALALLVMSLDMTVLNLALPTLSVFLRASTSQLQWIIDAYTLVTAAALLPGGLLGDRYGRKKVLLISLAVLARRRCCAPSPVRSASRSPPGRCWARARRRCCRCRCRCCR
jgi:MFS family permease